MKKVCISKDRLFREKESVSFRYTGQYETVDLPHDYEIAKPRTKHATAGYGNGFFESGAADYAKFIKFDKKEHVILDIDGAYMCAEVSLNEDIIIMHPHGYTPLLVDLTDRIQWGVHNRIGIKTLPHQPSARWYSGAGIYRDVFLWTGGKIRVEPWDLYMVTKDVNDTDAIVEMRAEITSDVDGVADINVKILDDCGNVLIDRNENIAVSSGKKTKLVREFLMKNVKLWNFEDEYLGELVKTDVYTVADMVKFTLNGKVVGTAKTESGVASMNIPYERGILEAEAITDGTVVGKAVLKTVGEPAKIHVIPEKDCFRADRRDLCYFQIIIEDGEGNRIPDANAELSCIIDGAELMCIFSGDPKNEDQYTSNKCHAFEGRALAVVRTSNPGDVRIIVGADGLESGTATVKAE